MLIFERGVNVDGVSTKRGEQDRDKIGLRFCV